MSVYFCWRVFPNVLHWDAQREQQVKDVLATVEASRFHDQEDNLHEYRPTDEETTDDERRLILMQLVRELVKDLPKSQQVSTLQLEGMDYSVHLAGGMTGGDDPSESFTKMGVLRELPEVYDLLLTFARADFARPRPSSSN